MYIDNVKKWNKLKVDWICCIQYRHSVMNHCDRHILCLVILIYNVYLFIF